MDLKKLLYFVTIVDEGQFTRAAQRLHMAQPPLSLQLKSLEQELGIKLLVRNHVRVEPTQAGWMFYQRAKEILNSVEGMITEVKELGFGVRGKLSIGTVMSCVSYLPKPIRIFQKLYPQVTFELQEGDSHQIEELLRSRLIEIGITRFPVSSNVEMIRLNTEPLVAVQPPEWNVFKTNKVSVDTLRDHPLLVLHSQGGKGIFEMFVEMCQGNGFNPSIICESPDVATLLTLVDSGIGIAIIPELAVHLRPAGTLSYAKITPPLQSDTAIIWTKDRQLSKAADHFKKILIESIHSSISEC